jgi:Protein of unknown function (DUF2934)
MKPKKPAKSKQSSEQTATRANQPGRAAVPERLPEQIARRACELYERRICQGALDDWLQAEQEILGDKKTGNAERPHRGGYAGEEQD